MPIGTLCGNSTDSDCDRPDICNGQGVCVANLLPNGTRCTSDGDPCTSDHCSSGECVHAASGDTDADSVCDLLDNCPQVANSDQADGDGDGVGDLCDNCAVDPNPRQENQDGDEKGDVCDPCPQDNLESQGDCDDLSVALIELNTGDPSTIRIMLRVVGSGDLTNVKLRFWYTRDSSGTNEVAEEDHIEAGEPTVDETFVYLNDPRPGADTYMEISFSESLGGNSGEMHLRIHRPDWTHYDFTNDHSVSGETITLHKSTESEEFLIWGVEP